MSKIIISEEDLTTNLGNNLSDTDVVFVPGFKGTGGTLTGEYSTPTLCETLAQFQAAFGTISPKFTVTQYYPVFDSENNKPGFQPNALPAKAEGETAPKMFEAEEADPGYVMASELLKAGLPVVYYCVPQAVKEGVTQPISVDIMYDVMAESIFPNLDISPTELTDNENQFKYITSGGYPVFEYNLYEGNTLVTNGLTNRMAKIAETRGDAIALIDHTNKSARVLTGAGSVFASINGDNKITDEKIETYAAMYTPWANYTLSSAYDNINNKKGKFPASFAYLISLAKSLKNNPNWYAIAGASRGLVPKLIAPLTDKKLTNAIANEYQEQEEGQCCINPITNIKPYGQCIWGNRTLRVYEEDKEGYATGFMNLRNMLCDIKKQAHVAAESLMFEQNNDVLWINFKGMITPLLDKMLSGNGLEYYKIIKVEDTSSKTKLSAQIKVKMIYAVEEFNISITVTDDDVTVE